MVQIYCPRCHAIVPADVRGDTQSRAMDVDLICTDPVGALHRGRRHLLRGPV